MITIHPENVATQRTFLPRSRVTSFKTRKRFIAQHLIQHLVES